MPLEHVQIPIGTICACEWHLLRRNPLTAQDWLLEIFGLRRALQTFPQQTARAGNGNRHMYDDPPAYSEREFSASNARPGDLRRGKWIASRSSADHTDAAAICGALHPSRLHAVPKAFGSRGVHVCLVI